MSYWHKSMSEETARRVLGDKHFEWAVSQGESYCKAQAGWAWMANTPETYAAYGVAAKLARSKK